MSVPDFERVRAIKADAQMRLLGIPGVHCVGIGAKMVGGVRTGEPSIIVLVVEKRDPSTIPPDELIPPEIDGVKTDVMQRPMPYQHAADVADDARPRPLEAGRTIMAGGLGAAGTLGFFGKLAGAYVAVTCQHVVGTAFGAEATTLTVQKTGISPGPYSLKISGTNVKGSFLYLKMFDADPAKKKTYNAYVVTGEHDTPVSIAGNLVAAVNRIPQIPLTAAADGTGGVTLTTATPLVLVRSFTVFDPRVPAKRVDLRADVSGNTIALSGSVSANYAVYVSWNTGGSAPTDGTFAAANANSDLTAVAKDIAKAVVARGVSATAAGATVTIPGADQVDCEIKPDVRVGQPTDTFCSDCCHCNDRIGVVTHARVDADAALVTLDGGMNFMAQIADIGPVKGVHDITDTEAHAQFKVQKRGALTGHTFGTVNMIEATGFMPARSAPPPAKQWTLFARYYTNAIQIDGVGADFSHPGDSGAAVLTNDANPMIVGLLFGGAPSDPSAPVDPSLPQGSGWATPIAQVTAAFPGLSVVTSPALGTVTVVPKTAAAHFAATPPALAAALEDMRAEITAIPAGARYAALVRRHFTEAQWLVNTNRRIATVWHRNGGPQLLARIAHFANRPDEPIPAEIGGRPLAECLARIEAAFARYASPAFAADLRRHGAALGALAGLTYPQALAAMQTWTVD